MIRTNTAVKRLREHAGKTQVELGKELGVTGTAVVHWEAGGGIGKYNRLVILEYAKRVAAPAEVIEAFENAKPEMPTGDDDGEVAKP